MGMIIHKTFGAGEIIDRDDKNCITVRFGNGKELRFAIPESFERGFITADGDLKEEVERIIAERKTLLSAKYESSESESYSAVKSKRVGKKSSKKTLPTGKTATDFINYLINAGYKTETDSGYDSTVYSYAKAAESVIKEEGVTWLDLESNIDDIVDKYDVGGAREDFGAKSNKTVINALKRFKEFVESK